MTPLDALLASGHSDAGTTRYDVDASWMQGRTMYGGLSAALALDTALRDHPGEAPLRSAQISFVGPVGGDAHAASRLVRQSKSSRFVAAEVASGAGFGTAAMFTFSQPRQSHVDVATRTPPPIAAPEALEPVPAHPARPSFTQHFDFRPAHGPHFRPTPGIAEVLTWVRWLEQPLCDPHVAMLALADALPPAALTAFSHFGPLSSSSWTTHFVTDTLTTDDGWWLLHSQSGHVRGGFSVQEMSIWNRAGDLVVAGHQGVAIYV